ncbi:MAG: FAD/NAD(P)-binding protein [Aerococcus suis]|nr:FAD/NAD(P)-binding protein [Aerococcus suis]
MRVAIIGLGASGTAITTELLNDEQFGENNRLDIFEPRERLGAGLPYEPEDERVLINTSPGALSMDKRNKQAFTDWLNTHISSDKDFSHWFAPRDYYGRYLNDHIQPYLADERVHVIKQRVKDMQILNQDGEVVYNQRHLNHPYYALQTTDNTWHQPYDAVFLAIGHPPYRDPYHLREVENYIHHPAPLKENLAHLNAEEAIGIIGSGLTGLDIIRYLNHHYTFEQPVTFYIRTEPFTTVIQPELEEEKPHSLTREWQAEQLETYGGIIPLQIIFEQIKADFKAHDITYDYILENCGSGSIEQIRHQVNEADPQMQAFQKYISGLYPEMSALINVLPTSDRQEFFTHYSKQIIHFLNIMPKETLELVIHLLDQGQLRIVSGLTDIEKTDQQFTLTANNDTYTADVLINATGFENRLSVAKEQDAFIKTLYEKGIIMADEVGGIKVTWPYTQLISSRYGQLDHVYTLGTWILATQFPNNAVSSNVRQACRIVHHFLDTYEE